MDSQPAFGFKELFAHIVGDMAQAISERNGESKQQQFTRCQAAAQMIMGLLPRDAIEAMLAGHCVMFHELIVDSIRDTLRGEMDTMRRATRSTIVAMDKAFGNNLTRLERYQLRPAEGRRDMPEVLPADAQAAMEVANQMPRPAAEAPARAAPKQAVPVPAPAAETREVPAQTQPSPPPPDETMVMFRPSPEAIAACRANPAAMAALDAGDAEAFARAMGIDMPSEAYLAAAAKQGSPFDRQASGNGSSGPATPPHVNRPDGGVSDQGRMVKA